MKPVIVTGDLLEQKVDVIVNAWNRNLIPWWLLLPQGVSGAIKRKAGIAPFCELRKHGILALGQAVLTGAGRLPFKGIIHVAGIGHSWLPSEKSVRLSTKNALSVAKAAGFHSIAFPVIGGGTGGMERSKAIDLMSQEIDASDYLGEVTIILFERHVSNPSTPTASVVRERPADWNLTIDDLFAEMKAGKRKSVGNPELAWAKEYDRSLIPEGTRFPQKGDVYEAKSDQIVQYMTAWNAPFTGDGEATLFKGERIWIDGDLNEERPISTYALPVDYDTLEKRMVPLKDREASRYGGFYFHFKTVELNKNFRLVQTGHDSKGV